MAVEEQSIERVRFGVDSGAACTVVKPTAASDYPVARIEPMKRLRAANGEIIKDLGNRHLKVRTGRKSRVLRTTVAPVAKNLLAVCQLVDTGHDVVFSQRGSFIKNMKSGEVMQMERINGTYEVEFDVEPYAAQGIDSVTCECCAPTYRLSPLRRPASP